MPRLRFWCHRLNRNSVLNTKPSSFQVSTLSSSGSATSACAPFCSSSGVLTPPPPEPSGNGRGGMQCKHRVVTALLCNEFRAVMHCAFLKCCCARFRHQHPPHPAMETQLSIPQFSGNCQSEAGTPVKKRRTDKETTECEPVKEDATQALIEENSFGCPPNVCGAEHARQTQHHPVADAENERQINQHYPEYVAQVDSVTESQFQSSTSNDAATSADQFENTFASIINSFLQSAATSQSNILPGSQHVAFVQNCIIEPNPTVLTEIQRSANENLESNSQKSNSHNQSQSLTHNAACIAMDLNPILSSSEIPHIGDVAVSVDLISTVSTEQNCIIEPNPTVLTEIQRSANENLESNSQKSNSHNQSQSLTHNAACIAMDLNPILSSSEIPHIGDVAVSVDLISTVSSGIKHSVCTSAELDHIALTEIQNSAITCACIATESMPIDTIFASAENSALTNHDPNNATPETNCQNSPIQVSTIIYEVNAQVIQRRPVFRNLHTVSCVPVNNRPERVQAQLSLATISKDDAGAIAAVKDMIGLSVAGESFGMALEMFFAAIQLGINLDIAFLCRDLLKMVTSTNHPEKLVSFFNAVIQIDENLLQQNHIAPFRNLCGGNIDACIPT